MPRDLRAQEIFKFVILGVFGTSSVACCFMQCWGISLENLVPLYPICCTGHVIEF